MRIPVPRQAGIFEGVERPKRYRPLSPPPERLCPECGSDLPHYDSIHDLTTWSIVRKGRRRTVHVFCFEHQLEADLFMKAFELRLG
jgi:hypothetical protein